MNDQTTVHATATRALRDAFYYAPGKAAPALSSLILLALATRILPLAEVGAYGLLISIVPAIALVFGGWLEQAVFKLYPDHDRRGLNLHFIANNERTLRNVVAVVSVLGATATGVAALVATRFVPYLLATTALIVTTVVANNRIANMVVRSQKRTYLFLQSIRAGLSVLLGWAALHVFGTAWVVLVALAIAQLPLILHVRLLGSKPTSDTETFRQAAFAYGFPLVLWSVGAQVLAIADRYMVNAFQGPEAAGIYYASYVFVPTALQFALGPLIMAAQPLIMSLSGGSRTSPEALITETSRTFVRIAIPMAAIAVALATPLTHILLGSEVWGGVIIVPWVVVGVLLWEFAAYGHKRFEIRGKTRALFWFVFSAAAINVLLNLILIPRFGITGAAFATTLSYAAYAALVYIVPRSDVRWLIPWKSLTVSCGIAGAVYVTMKWFLRSAPLAAIPQILATGLFGLAIATILLLLFQEFPGRAVRLRRPIPDSDRSRIRILMVNDTVEGFGGAEAVMHDEALQLDRAGHSVKMFGGRQEGKARSFVSRWFSLRYYWNMRREIRLWRPDVIHAHGVSRRISPAPLVAAARQGIPVVMTLHDATLYCAMTWATRTDNSTCPGFSFRCLSKCKGFIGQGVFAYPARLVKFLIVALHRRLLANLVSTFIAPSPAMLSLAQSWSGSRGKTILIRNYSINEGLDRPQHLVKEMNPVTIFFLGRIGPEKGAIPLVRALDVVLKRRLNVRAIIAGTGPQLPEVEQLVADLELENHVDLLGRVPSEDLPRIRARAHVAVVPSLWFECFGLVAVDAMRVGLPIIASRTGGLQDLVEHGRSGILVPPGDVAALARAIGSLVDNPEFRQSMGVAAAERYHQWFSAERHLEELLACYRRATSDEALSSEEGRGTGLLSGSPGSPNGPAQDRTPSL